MANAKLVVRPARRLGLVAFLVAALAAACSPPTNSSGSSDGGIAVAPTTSPASAPVDVVLLDTAGTSSSMSIVTFANTVPAGDVTFRVKNLGTIEHELVVLKTDTAFDQLPIADAGDPPAPVKTGANKVDETNNVGETGDPNLKPGDTREFTIKNMAAGRYVLVCNLADHYKMGMRAPFTVSPSAAGPVTVTLGDTRGVNAPMTITPATTTATHGDVTFAVKNNGTIEHELVVLKTDVPYDQIPITDAGDPPAPVKVGANKLDEANNIGETGDPNLKPGDTRTFTIKDMAPGKYVLICNLADHYRLGMRAPFTVS